MEGAWCRYQKCCSQKRFLMHHRPIIELCERDYLPPQDYDSVCIYELAELKSVKNDHHGLQNIDNMCGNAVQLILVTLLSI